MSLSSVDYLFFLVLALAFIHLTKTRWRWLSGLLASLAFYAAFGQPSLLLMLSLTTLTGYCTGLLLGWFRRFRGLVLASGIVTLVAILLYTRYLIFLANLVQSAGDWLHLSIPTLNPVPLPTIGVSFYVFQAISYLIDVYLGTAQAERHLGYFALYLSFFPKLLQGPIERANNLLPQLRCPKPISWDCIRLGLLMMGCGLFKKVVVADRLGLLVDNVYQQPQHYSGLVLLLATYGYALQLYFDFSAYMDLARGSAKLLGIDLSPNFNLPYLASSVADFWRRWHMTFSRWLFDYLFKPIQLWLRYWKTAGTVIALLITFFISGLWHGPSWGYVCWGLLHGLFLAIGVVYRPIQKRIHQMLHLEKTRLLKFWQTAFTFHLVCLAWVFFRAEKLNDAVYIITHFFSGVAGVWEFLLAHKHWNLIVLGASLLGLLGVHLLRSHLKEWQLLLRCPWYCRWAFYYAFGYALIAFGIYSQPSFIYFKF